MDLFGDSCEVGLEGFVGGGEHLSTEPAKGKGTKGGKMLSELSVERSSSEGLLQEG